MQHISTIQPTKETDAPHELSDMTELIRKKIGFSGRYGRGYWLKKLKQANISYGQLEAIVEKAVSLPQKYNRGGYISNRLVG